MAHPDEVIEFWFADALDSPEATAARSPFWFGNDSSADSLIWELYADTVGDAAVGHYDDWLDTARGRLAMIIVLDQFPRNIFRGTAEVYRYDPMAMTLAQAGVALGQLAGMSVPEQAFFLMPYQHSEELEVQHQGVALMQAMVASAPPEWQAQARSFADFAVRHHDIVESYGRFPHRNKVLGRLSTTDEDNFLTEGGETFGQAG